MAQEPKKTTRPAKKPRHMKIYFTNGNTAIFEFEKVLFMQHSGAFSLHGDMEITSYSEMIRGGRVLVNWDAVSWVREYEEALD